jgi:hypothetical protein
VDWRSAAGRLPARPLQRLVGLPRRWLGLNSRNGDSPVTELRNDFQRPTKGFDIPSEGCHLAVFKIGPSLKTRDVSLIDLRLLCDIDLRLTDGIAQCPQRQMNASCGAKAAAEHSDRLDVGFCTSPSG